MIWRGSDRIGLLRPGVKIRFFENKLKTGRYVDVITDQIRIINMASFSEEDFENWSKLEGWSVNYAKGLSSKGVAFQVLFHREVI